jgi:hypothetical protein
VRPAFLFRHQQVYQSLQLLLLWLSRLVCCHAAQQHQPPHLAHCQLLLLHLLLPPPPPSCLQQQQQLLLLLLHLLLPPLQPLLLTRLLSVRSQRSWRCAGLQLHWGQVLPRPELWPLSLLCCLAPAPLLLPALRTECPLRGTAGAGPAPQMTPAGTSGHQGGAWQWPQRAHQLLLLHM